MTRLRHILLASTAIQSAATLAVPALAADLVVDFPDSYFEEVASRPALSPGMTFGGMACATGDIASVAALMSVTVPLGDRVGAQLDGVVGIDLNGGISGQAAGHLFVRDSNIGMLGAYGAYVNDGVGGRNDGFRLGGEGEWYLNGFTLSGLVGWDFANADMFGQGRLSAYLGSNTKLYGAYIYEGRHIGAVGIEHMFNASATGFAEGRFGENGYVAGLAGLKFHFGGGNGVAGIPGAVLAGEDGDERTLIQHDREDVVPLWLQACGDDDDTTVVTTATTDPTPPTKPTKPPLPLG